MLKSLLGLAAQQVAEATAQVRGAWLSTAAMAELCYDSLSSRGLPPSGKSRQLAGERAIRRAAAGGRQVPVPLRLCALPSDQDGV